MDHTLRNEKKRHHFIPITYLNNFTDNSVKLFAYRKDEPERHLHVTPDAIGFEKYYYSQPLPEGGRDNNTFEGFFGTIESKWNGLAVRMRSGADGISDWSSNEFQDLFTFMGLMRVRVPAARDMVEVMLAEHVKTMTRLLDQQGKLPSKPLGTEDILEHLKVAIDPHMSLRAMGRLMIGFGIVVDHVGFEVLHNETGMSFVTSDNPVVCFDPTVPEASVSPYQVRPPYGSIELIFPIDPNTMLRGRSALRRPGPPSLRHVKLTDRGEAKRINRFLARFGYRFVFARDRTHESLIVKHASTSPVMQMISEPNSTSEPIMHCVFGPRPIKPKWNY
jgi:hypothetical protein